MTFCPFCVFDRPNHAKILIEASRRTQAFGALTRAGVSDTVKELTTQLEVPVLVDSGEFADVETEQGILELFEIYEEMDADYALIPDEIGDRDSNNDTFAVASRIYERSSRRWSFRPVGVAQGSTPAEYASSYWDLYQMGADYIAVGGLLEKTGDRSGGHATGRSDLFDILREVRDRNPRIWRRTWTFALGCDHPDRRRPMKELGVMGSDSKRWLFQYDSDGAISRQKQLADALVRDVAPQETTTSEFAAQTAAQSG